MKLILTTLVLFCCSYAVHAQNNSAGPNGTGSSIGNQYSNGSIPNPNEQTQNRPDSTLRSADTTYMHQQWNDSSTQEHKKTNKHTTTPKKTAPKSASTTTKKKK